MSLNIKRLMPLNHPYITYPHKGLKTANKNTDESTDAVKSQKKQDYQSNKKLDKKKE